MAAQEFGTRFGRYYGRVSPLYTEDAETVVVSAGTICGTIREVVEQRRERGERVGMVKLHAFRPFPTEALRVALGNARRVIVIDRNLAPGLGGIFASEIRLALHARGVPATVYSFIAGLGGSDVPPGLLESALDYASEQADPPDTLFLLDTGIEA